MPASRQAEKWHKTGGGRGNEISIAKVKNREDLYLNYTKNLARMQARIGKDAPGYVS
jgi:hypothetical protein